MFNTHCVLTGARPHLSCTWPTTNIFTSVTLTFTLTGHTHWDGRWHSRLCSWCHCGQPGTCVWQQEPFDRSVPFSYYTQLWQDTEYDMGSTAAPNGVKTRVLYHLTDKVMCSLPDLVCRSVCPSFVVLLRTQPGCLRQLERPELLLNWQTLQRQLSLMCKMEKVHTAAARVWTIIKSQMGLFSHHKRLTGLFFFPFPF